MPRIDLEGWKIDESLAIGILKLIEFMPRICVEFLDRDEVFPDKGKLKELFPLNDKQNH